MTYRCAIGESMQAIGVRARPASYHCDQPFCRASVEVVVRRRLPPLWHTKRGRPPRWVRVPMNESVFHFCADHRGVHKDVLP